MSRKEFLKYIALSMSAVVAAIAGACSSAPDAETEPSPEWPPAE